MSTTRAIQEINSELLELKMQIDNLVTAAGDVRTMIERDERRPRLTTYARASFVSIDMHLQIAQLELKAASNHLHIKRQLSELADASYSEEVSHVGN